MCGIAGIIGSNQEYCRVQLLEAMLSAMIHRGPNGTHIETFSESGFFGHNRLAVIDLNPRAKQPMWDATHRYCLTFNGEIYNFREIKKVLIQLGRHFCTESDSEVLVEAWAEWGISAIDRLVGMFAFGVWDDQLKQLFLVRDRMGEKPLYYAPIKNDFLRGLIFSSELKGLLVYPFFQKKISPAALDYYLSYGYASSQEAIFENSHKLPPASYLQFDCNTGQHRLIEYWSLSHSFKNKCTLSFSDATENLRTLLKNSVISQLISDVPLGAFLSGGIDSSAIVGEMAKNHKVAHTFSIGFREKSYSELKNSKIVSRHFSTEHHTKIVGDDIENHVEKIIGVFDEPFTDTSLIPMYYLSQYTREKVTVALSGDGGDELFGGYSTYQADRYHRVLSRIPPAIKNQLIKACAYLPVSHKKISFDYKIKQFLQGALLNNQQAHFKWREIFSKQQKNQLLLFPGEMPDTLSLNLRWFKDVEGCHYLDQAMYVDMKTWLVDDILTKSDRTSMAHSLEVRAPFLDHRLVEFAASLPIQYKIQSGSGKHVLKASQKKILPNKIIFQSKKGFNSPISHWLSGELFKMAHDITTSQCMLKWFNQNAIEKLWLEHQKGVCDNGYRLFNLMCLGLWHQQHLS